MSDTTTNGLSNATSASLLQIPVTKSGTAKFTVEVSTEMLPDTYYSAALKEGLKVIVNGGASKITKETYPVDDERFAAAKALAAERVQAMYDNKLKLGRGSATAKGIPAAVMTEARRLAREIVKQTLKDNGMKVSHYAASEITAAANALIEADPDLIKQAETNLANRGKLKTAAGDALTKVMANVEPDQKLVAKAEKAAEDKKANKIPLSAMQAGKVAPHAH